jgi:hypothetical protein
MAFTRFNLKSYKMTGNHDSAQESFALYGLVLAAGFVLTLVGLTAAAPPPGSPSPEASILDYF